LIHVVAGRRRALAVWAFVLATVSGGYAAMFPVMEGFDMQGMIDSLPPAMVEALGYDDLGSAAGYLASAVFSMVSLGLLMVFGIGSGARLIAGREDDGTLELELAAPVPRSAIYGQRLAALWVELTALVSAVFAVTLALVVGLNLDVTVGNLAAVCLELWLLVGLYSTVSFAVGAATGRRIIALAVAAGLATVGWMLDAMGPTIGQDWMSAISPFAWYMAENPLAHGLNVTGSLLMATVSLVAGAAGWIRFSRRDLMT
jgi:ABC-2 type transport system permease protein